MARVNIEDDLIWDPRFLSLSQELGDFYTALGLLVFTFKKAQKYWLKHGAIPIDEFKKIKHHEKLISHDLARMVVDDQFVYICGSSSQFEWLTQRSKAGQKITPNKLKKLSEARSVIAKKRSLNGTERELTGENKSEPLSISLSLERESIINNTFFAGSKNSETETDFVPIPKTSFWDAHFKKVPTWFEQNFDASWLDKALALYQDPNFIFENFSKVDFWLTANRTKTPKSTTGWRRFFNGWLERGWERHRKSLPSNNNRSAKVELV